MKIIKRRFSLNKEKPETEAELPDDVIDRVNIGVIAVSLSLYEEGMSLDELIEVTGIREADVRKSLDYLMINRMVRKKLNQESYHVSNFKKIAFHNPSNWECNIT